MGPISLASFDMSQHEIALILNINKPYDRKVVAGIARFTRTQSDWRLYVEDEPLAKIPNLKRWRGHGIIADLDDPNVLDAVTGLKIPVVNIGGAVFAKSWKNETPYVTTDNSAVAQLAADHLMNQGFTNFAYCGIRQSAINPWSTMRGDAFRKILRQHGHDCSEYYGRHTSARQWESVQARICRWLATLPRPLGLFACNDARARHVQESCRRLNLQIPADVAILGVDNDELMCELANPALSSISLGTNEIGYEAARLLDDLIAGRRVAKKRKKVQVAPVGIITRESTNTIAIADEVVAQAVEYIRTNIDSSVRVADVTRDADLSRSTLDNRFKQVLGRTVHDEIERVRLERTRELLATTDCTLSEIALQTGFGTVHYLAAVFRQSTGQTPGEFRKSNIGSRMLE